jgi:hypothetical protein
MSDISQQTPPPAPTPPPMNDDLARSSTGEILDQSTPPTTPTTPPDPTSNPPSEPTSTPPKDPEVKPTDAKAPDAYADFKAPDGYTIDPKTIEAATPIFKEMGLSQEQAQKLVDFHTQQMIAAAKAPTDTVESMRNDWTAKVKADPELTKAVNGDKTGLDAVKLDIARAYSALPPELAQEMKTAMDLTGAGDHPAIIKGIWKLSQFITEGKHVSGTGPSPHGQKSPDAKPPSIANALYPNLPG